MGETWDRNAAETKITSLERNIKTLMVEIEELRQVKINLEGSISKWQAENADWKKKYENEARLRVEEGDALKKKFTMEITSLTDALHNMEQKLKAAENAKAKLTSEVGVLVKDFEHSQVVIKELTAKLGSSDKTCNDLAIKLKEMTNLYEKADRDSKARAQDVVKMGNEMDRVKMANESILHGGVLLLRPCLQGHSCWLRCWRSVLLQGWLCCQGWLHLQGVQHGQGRINGQGFLLSPLLDPTPPASAIFNRNY